MSGPFYGSLAASASVFVAILTALLVNNYIQIKSERRQLTRRINQVDRDLEDLRKERDEYQETIEQIRREEEQELRQEAEENVDAFVSNYLSEQFHYPIEKLTVDELHQELLDYYDCNSADELEESDETQHHRDVLEDRKEKLENLILNRTVHEFASRHEGKGNVEDPRESGESDFSEEEENFLDGIDFGMDFQDFVDEYKDEYDVEDLDDRTRDLLKEEYDEVVDKDYGDRKFGELVPTEEQVAETLVDALEMSGGEGGSDDHPLTIGDMMEEGDRERRYETARDNLIQTKSEIESLQRTKEDLQQQKEGQHPEDLKPTLYVNAVTIFLSVVVPMAAYLDTVTEFTITQLGWINIWVIGGSWLLGLIIVFVAIYFRITGRELRARLPQKPW